MNEMSKTDIMFYQLVLTFQNAAQIQLGQVKNPQTDKIERDLKQANYSIDLLDMLKVKTRGNLNPEEEKLLNNIVSTLKMVYVAESENEKTDKNSPENIKNNKTTEKKTKSNSKK